MSSIDQQFVEFIVRSLVSKPDAVVVERRIDEKGVLLELTVDPEDLGRVIGKRGATAQSLRTLLRALGTKNDARYNLKIVDNGEPRPENAGQQQPAAPPVSDDYSQPVSQPKQDDDLADLRSDDELDVPKRDRQDESDGGSMVSKTRRELEELDDLDV
jgi:predicted RNA-binding protein YlqC (UPF0109 family)